MTTLASLQALYERCGNPREPRAALEAELAAIVGPLSPAERVALAREFSIRVPCRSGAEAVRRIAGKLFERRESAERVFAFAPQVFAM